jgi:hypothetical protein
MRTLLANGNMFFVVGLAFRAGDVAHRFVTYSVDFNRLGSIEFIWENKVPSPGFEALNLFIIQLYIDNCQINYTTCSVPGSIVYEYIDSVIR